MENEALNNPAGRIATFIAALAEATDREQTNDQFRNKRVLASALNLSSLESAGIVSRLGELMEQVERIKALIESGKISSLYAAMLPELERYMESLLSGVQGQGLAVPQPLLSLVLNLCSEQLSELAPENVPKLDDLWKVRGEITSLLDDVVEAALDLELKLFLSQELHNLLDGIDRFRISGVSPIRDALLNVVVDIQASNAMSEDRIGGEEDITNRFRTLVKRLAQLVYPGAALANIAAVVIPALESGHPH